MKVSVTNLDFKPILNRWLANFKDLICLYCEEFDAITGEEEKTDRLVELNVCDLVLNLARTPIIQRTWKDEQRPGIHGWVYGLKVGLIKPVCEMKIGTHIDNLYEYRDL